MAKVFIVLVWFYYLILYAEACRDTLWFQASHLASAEELTSGKFRLQANGRHQTMALLQLNSRSVRDATECARLCYVTMATMCGSAVFEQQGQLGTNWCRLMPWNFPCALARNLVASVDRPGSVMLLHCPYCNRFAGGLGGQRQEFASEVDSGGDDFLVAASTTTTTTTSTTTTTATTEAAGNFRRVEELAPSEERNSDRSTTKLIRVMTFNTWISGQNVRDGVAKIARHIFANDPHVVGMQEMDDYSAYRLRNLLTSLYEQDRRPDIWYHCRRNEGGTNHILTRFSIAQEYPPSTYLKNNGCQLKIQDQPPRYFQIWNLHLHWEDYGPYAACDRVKATSRNLEDLLFYSEYKPREPGRSRVHQTLRFLHNKAMKDFITSRDSASPFMVVMGDFNSPSHLDWTIAASSLHCNVSYEWPVSKLMTDSGFVDSYRRVNEDPLRQPGATWTPLYKTKTWISSTSNEPEPQDRIDFIYYLSGNPWLTVRRSVVYNGDKEVRLHPYHYDNDWPSDHASVVTDFELVV